MPYPANHSVAVRAEIVDSARKLFNRHGFDGVSIDQIMSGAGLTRGGFYSHFKSKSDLYAEVLGCFFTDPNWKNQWEGVVMDFAAEEPGPQVVRAYLSRQHFENVENSCPMVALTTDVSRSGRPAKAAFENVFRAMVALLERSVKRRAGSSRAVSSRATQARAMDDRRVGDELRDACMSVALELGGWPAVRGAKRNGNGNGHGVKKAAKRGSA